MDMAMFLLCIVLLVAKGLIQLQFIVLIVEIDYLVTRILRLSLSSITSIR